MNLMFFGKKLFHKNPLLFRLIADFEADKEVDGSNIGKKNKKNLQTDPSTQWLLYNIRIRRRIKKWLLRISFRL